MESKKVFTCSCSRLNHSLQVTKFDGEEEVYLSVILDKEIPFFKRLKAAFLYLINKPCSYGACSEFVLSKEDAKLLSDELIK